VKINFHTLMTMAGRIYFVVFFKKFSRNETPPIAQVVRGVFFPSRSDVVRPSFQLTWNPENRRCDSFFPSSHVDWKRPNENNQILFWFFFEKEKKKTETPALENQRSVATHQQTEKKKKTISY
jgi:hypothetical protein